MNMSQLIKWVKDILREENTLFRYTNSLKEAGTYQISLDDGSSKSIYLINSDGRLKVMLHHVSLTPTGIIQVKCRTYDVNIEPQGTVEKHIKLFIRGEFVPKYSIAMV